MCINIIQSFLNCSCNDFVSLFEPQALEVEKQGYGYVVASLGELGGVVPYTAYKCL